MSAAGHDQLARRGPVHIHRVVWGGVLVTMAAMPLLISRNSVDLYATPKTAFFQGSMLLIGAIAVAAALLWRETADQLLRARGAAIAAAVAVLWAAVVSLTSLNETVSRNAPFAVFTHALLFVLTVAFASRRVMLPILAVVAPAVINAVIVLLQTAGIWYPIALGPEVLPRLTRTGLIGNPNTVATYLLLPLIAAFAGAYVSRRHRAAFVSAAVLLAAAVIATQTITVMAPLVLAAAVAIVTSRSRGLTVAALTALLLGVGAAAAYAPLRARVEQIATQVRHGDFSEATSRRLPAYAVAWDMFRARPLLGVGPGNFASRYMSARLAVEHRHPSFITNANTNFGEVHNDHLELLAEGGLPAWFLFAAALVSVAVLPRYADHDESGRFVRAFARPAVAGFALLALGQFPLQLTVTSATAVFLGALCWAWSADATA